MSPGPKQHGKQWEQKKSHRNTKKQQKRAQEVTLDSTEKSLEPAVEEVGGENTKRQLAENVEDEMVPYNRKIASNWDRYKELPDENISELPTGRGQDLQILLDYCASSSSQFKLQREKEWEEELKESSANEFLTVDCYSLSEALQCIPLHHRLGISNHDLPAELITQFQEDAELNLRYFGLGKRQSRISNKTADNSLLQLTTTCIDPKQSLIPGSSLQTTDLMPHSEKTALDVLIPVVQPKQVVEMPDQKLMSHDLSSPQDMARVELVDAKDSDRTTTVEPTDAKDSDKTTSMKSTEEELDFLLSLKKPSSECLKTKKVEESAKKSSSVNLDEWLDSLTED